MRDEQEMGWMCACVKIDVTAVDPEAGKESNLPV